MKDVHQAYGEAGKIDKQINELLEKYPVTKENARAWRVFARTIRTTFVLVEHMIEDVANPKRSVSKHANFQLP